MTRTRFGALVALTLSFVLAACSTPDLTAKPSSPSTALVTDADLDAASLELATTDVALSATDEGTAPEGAEIDLSGESQLSSQAVIPGASGYINYLRVDKSSGTTLTQLWLANQATDQSTLIYEGTRSITSTTVNLAGNTVFFTAAVTTGSSNFDVYKLTLSNNAVSRLTTTTAENDISVSANGQIVVWGGIKPSGGKRAVFVRTYSGTSFTQKILGISNGNLYEPTVSGDGAWIAMIRQTTSTQVVRYQRSSNSYLTVVTPSTSVYVRAPSVSNGGGKVAWGENPKQCGSSTVKVKTISGGSTATVASVAGLIQQPQLTSDSAYITYAAFYNGALNVFTKKLSGGQTVRITSDTSPNLSTGMFWQKDATVTPATVTITGAVSAIDDYPIRVKLFQVATGALYREVALLSNGRYSFTNVLAARYYVTAYSDRSYDAIQNVGESAGAFGRPAIPQQLSAVSGSYTANITLTTNPYEIEDNSSIDTDNILLLGTTINGYTSGRYINNEEDLAYDYDYYKLLVPAAGTYSLETSGVCDGQSEGSLDTYLELYSASGTLLEGDDDGGINLCSLISYTFTQSGTYFIAVRPLNSDEGDYSLIFQR